MKQAYLGKQNEMLHLQKVNKKLVKVMKPSKENIAVALHVKPAAKNMKMQMHDEHESKKDRENKRRVELINRYRQVVAEDSSEARAIIKKLNYRNDHFLLICIASTFYDESIYDKNGGRREYFDMRKLNAARKYAQSAFDLSPGSEEVLWVMGKIANAYQQKDQSIMYYKSILKNGVAGLIDAGKDLEYSFGLMRINDSNFQLYRLYFDRGDYEKSTYYLRKYKDGLKGKKVKTLFKPLSNYIMK